MLYDYLNYLRKNGHQVDDSVVLDFYRHLFGELPEEWTPQQKKNVRKEVIKIFNKMEVPHKPNIDEVVEYLWASGWEYRSGVAGVYGLDTFVKNWYVKMYPKEDMELALAEQNDPVLKETVEILKRFYLDPNPRECRMILREGLEPKWIQYACELHRSWGTQVNNWSVKVVLETARDKYNRRNDKYVFDF